MPLLQAFRCLSCAQSAFCARALVLPSSCARARFGGTRLRARHYAALPPHALPTPRCASQARCIGVCARPPPWLRSPSTLRARCARQANRGSLSSALSRAPPQPVASLRCAARVARKPRASCEAAAWHADEASPRALRTRAGAFLSRSGAITACHGRLWADALSQSGWRARRPSRLQRAVQPFALVVTTQLVRSQRDPPLRRQLHTEAGVA